MENVNVTIVPFHLAGGCSGQGPVSGCRVQRPASALAGRAQGSWGFDGHELAGVVALAPFLAGDALVAEAAGRPWALQRSIR